MSLELPPLPAHIPDGIVSHETIRAYGRQCARMALDAAADQVAAWWVAGKLDEEDLRHKDSLLKLAAVIRKL